VKLWFHGCLTQKEAADLLWKAPRISRSFLVRVKTQTQKALSVLHYKLKTGTTTVAQWKERIIYRREQDYALTDDDSNTTFTAPTVPALLDKLKDCGEKSLKENKGCQSLLAKYDDAYFKKQS